MYESRTVLVRCFTHEEGMNDYVGDWQSRPMAALAKMTAAKQAQSDGKEFGIVS